MFVCNVKISIKKIMIWLGIIAVTIAICLELGLFNNKASNIESNKNKYDYVINENNFK